MKMKPKQRTKASWGAKAFKGEAGGEYEQKVYEATVAQQLNSALTTAYTKCKP